MASDIASDMPTTLDLAKAPDRRDPRPPKGYKRGWVERLIDWLEESESLMWMLWLLSWWSTERDSGNEWEDWQ